jgi:hypothetical protein
LGIESDAVVDPGAVVVHHDDAAATFVAVVHVWWLERVADKTLLFDYFVNGSIPRYREISIRLPNLIIHQHVKIYLLTLFIRELAPLFTIIFIAYQIPSSRQIFEHLFVFFPAIEF